MKNRVVKHWTLHTAVGIVGAFDSIWANGGSGIARIDPSTNTVVAEVRLTPPLGDPDVVAGKVWAPLIRENAVAIIDPATNQVERTLKVGIGPFVVTTINGEAWIPSWKGRDIWRLKP